MIPLLHLHLFFKNVSLLLKSFVVLLLKISSETPDDSIFLSSSIPPVMNICVHALVVATDFSVLDHKTL